MAPPRKTRELFGTEVRRWPSQPPVQLSATARVRPLHVEHEQHDLFERVAVGGEDLVGHLVLDELGDFVDAGFGFDERFFTAEEVELDLGVAGEDGGFDVA